MVGKVQDLVDEVISKKDFIFRVYLSTLLGIKLDHNCLQNLFFLLLIILLNRYVKSLNFIEKLKKKNIYIAKLQT